jgi:hypothetical protein
MVPANAVPTVGAEFMAKSVSLSNGETAKIQFWDTGFIFSWKNQIFSFFYHSWTREISFDSYLVSILLIFKFFYLLSIKAISGKQWGQ